MSERTNKGTGQNVTKSKFRQKSQQEQVAASKLRMEKRSEQLDKATEKLAKQKPQKKPGPVKKAGRATGATVHGYVHGKLYEVEHENVGTESAHRAELVGEAALRSTSQYVKRKVREHPAKAVQQAESRHRNAVVDYQYRATVEKHPGMQKSGAVSRYIQKQKIKRQYAKQARETATVAKETAVATEKLIVKTAAFVKLHPGGVLLFLACFLLLVIMQSCMSSVVTIGNGVAGAIGASTYAAEDADLRGAEQAYCALEEELQDYLDSYERTHDYDEYHFDLDTMEHDPYVLLSLISALHEGTWTLDEVQGTLQMLFEQQYILTESVVTEVRYRTERYTWVDEEGNLRIGSYHVPYNYTICTVTLENFNLSHLPIYVLSEEQLSRYALYMATLGNRPELFPSSPYVAKYTAGPVEYEIPEAYLADETFAAIIAEAEKYIGYPYIWGGYKPSTSFDCSGFVSYVYNQCGWNFGRLGAQGLYGICTRVRSPRPGDLVFFTGTYDVPGITHCGIYVGDGLMLHCGDPIGYANLNTDYWQTHFYAYGRLP